MNKQFLQTSQRESVVMGHISSSSMSISSSGKSPIVTCKKTQMVHIVRFQCKNGKTIDKILGSPMKTGAAFNWLGFVLQLKCRPSGSESFDVL